MAINKLQRQKKLLKCLEEDSVISIACQKAQISRATYYRWVESDKQFVKLVNAARSKGDDKYNDISESKLMQLVAEGNIRAIMFRLNNKHPDYSYPKVLPYQKEPAQLLEPIKVMGSIKGPTEKD